VCVCQPPEVVAVEDDSEAHFVDPLPIDVYALGIILWQLWFKQAPFAGKSALAIISRVAKG
jgi:hypothetical protein